MTIFTILSRYMAIRFAVTILVVFSVTFLIIFFVDFVEVLRSGSRFDNVSAGMLALVALLRVPVFAELALPFAILIGTIAAFLSFSRTSELTIIRASGVSVWQFLQPGLLVGFVIGVFAVTVYNPVASATKAMSERIQTELFNNQSSFGTIRMSGSWLRQEGADGPTILHAKASADRGLTLGGVTLLQFDLNNRFYEQIQATKAELSQGYWRLENAVVQGSGTPMQRYGEYFVSTYLSPVQIMNSIGSIETLSFWELPGFINFAKKAGIPTEQYELQYQLMLARPILLAAMVLIAATCSLKPFRFGRIQTMVLTGLIGGFGFFIVSEISRKVGASGLVPVTVAAWAPAIMALLLSATVLLHQEDG
ncbi:MAG: LPS export ABC transporter permease LptG [Rhodomicrobium sp.]